MPDGLILAAPELLQLTGYRQPAAQLAALQRLGFTRARRERNGCGAVIVERAHYMAVVSAGAAPERQAQNEAAAPNLVGLEEWAKKRGQRGQKAQG